MPEKVEKIKLSKEQIGFTKNYKQLLKVQKGLLATLKVKMSEADMLRSQLGEVEAVLGGLTQQAPPPFLNELEGQEMPAAEEMLR